MMHTKIALVLGLGVSGQGAARFLMKNGVTVLGVDRNVSRLEDSSTISQLKKEGLQLFSEDGAAEILNKIDLFVLSSGIPRTHPLVLGALNLGKEVIGEMELGCEALLQKPMPALGITGTNGKTTTSFLVEHILKEAGWPTAAIGNSGLAITEALAREYDPRTTWVVELSSFQLEKLPHRFLDAGALLNITPDHLDRYVSMDAYAAAKCAIMGCLKKRSPLYIGEKTAQDFSSFFVGRDYLAYGYLPTSAIYTDLTSLYWEGAKMLDWPPFLKGRRSHDMENAMAAYALSREYCLPEQFLAALNTFKKPPHRMEFVVEKRGVRYYNDSKGTNVDAVIRAIEGLEGSVILIAGGVDKGASYTIWLEPFRGKVRLVCAIGQAAEKMKEELSSELPVTIFNNLEEAVHYASEQALKGEVVILAPGCASYGMFKDYVDRGNQFKKIVEALVLV